MRIESARREKRKIAQMASYLNHAICWGKRKKKKASSGVQPGFLTSCMAGNVFIQYNCHRSTSLKWMPLQSKLKRTIARAFATPGVVV